MGIALAMELFASLVSKKPIGKDEVVAPMRLSWFMVGQRGEGNYGTYDQMEAAVKKLLDGFTSEQGAAIKRGLQEYYKFFLHNRPFFRIKENWKSYGITIANNVPKKTKSGKGTDGVLVAYPYISPGLLEDTVAAYEMMESLTAIFMNEPSGNSRLNSKPVITDRGVSDKNPWHDLNFQSTEDIKKDTPLEWCYDTEKKGVHGGYEKNCEGTEQYQSDLNLSVVAAQYIIKHFLTSSESPLYKTELGSVIPTPEVVRLAYTRLNYMRWKVDNRPSAPWVRVELPKDESGAYKIPPARSACDVKTKDGEDLNVVAKQEYLRFTRKSCVEKLSDEAKKKQMEFRDYDPRKYDSEQIERVLLEQPPADATVGNGDWVDEPPEKRPRYDRSISPDRFYDDTGEFHENQLGMDLERVEVDENEIIFEEDGRHIVSVSIGSEEVKFSLEGGTRARELMRWILALKGPYFFNTLYYDEAERTYVYQ